MRLEDFDAVIYDMDGVLIDSEPLWKIAMEESFKSVGCSLTKKDFEKTVGLRIDEVIKYWYSVAPWSTYTPKQVEDQIIERLIRLIEATGEELSGVEDSLKFFKSKGKKIGLGTSSYTLLIDTVLAKLNIRSYFDFTHSAENEEHGKPHPAVYLTVAEKLSVSPMRCLVIEDSLTGVIAAKAARMIVVAVPEKSHQPNEKLIVADEIHESIPDLIESLKS
jgi:HAD superfamily hydrolase (TIGR01509 family)